MSGRAHTGKKESYHEASEHLRQCQPQIRQLVAAIGPCTLQPNADHFGVLVRTIVSQQLSTQAANTICTRLESVFGKRDWQPARVLKTRPEAMRACGLSAAKAASLLDLAEKVENRTVPLKRIARMDDDEVRSTLLEVKGIGPWSVDMFLIFSLGRIDILPVGDLGLRAGIKDLFSLAELPGAVELEEIAATWRPYRSIATWYVWRSRGGVPQSDDDGKTHKATARRKRS